MLEHLLRLDDAILLYVNHLNSAFADEFMWMVSDKWIWIPFYMALAYVLWRAGGWKGFLVSLAVVGLTFAVTDHFSVQVFRSLFSRMRPAYPENPIAPMVHLVNDYRSGRYGFPSAHAANTAGLATALSLLLRQRRATLLLSVWVVLVCYSRMYLGVHYLGDLLAGAAFGITVAYLAWRLAKHFFGPWLQMRGARSTWLIPTAICTLTVLGIAFHAGLRAM